MSEMHAFDHERTGRWPVSAESSILNAYDSFLSYLRDRSSSQEVALPPEYELIRYFGVHRNALRSALKRLSEAGLVSRKRGRGTFWHTTPHSHRILSSSGLSAGLSREWGEEITRRPRLSQTVSSSPFMSKQFGLPEGTPLRMIERITCLEGEPIGLWTYYFPESLVALEDPAEFCGDADSFMAKAEHSGETKVCFFISADTADSDLACTLEIPEGSLLLHLERKVVDERGNVLMIGYGRLRNDRLVLAVNRDGAPREGGSRKGKSQEEIGKGEYQ